MVPADNSPQEITQMLRRWGDGDQGVAEQLLPLVYDELHRQAARYLRRERPGHTLQTTALIHEAYMKLVGQHVQWQSRTHFYAIAANLMRRIMVDYARTKHRDKRGGSDIEVPLDDAEPAAAPERSIDLLALDQALNRLAEFDPEQARLVELRYFSGLTLEDTADAMKVSRATAAREWSAARAWLHRELTRTNN